MNLPSICTTNAIGIAVAVILLISSRVTRWRQGFLDRIFFWMLVLVILGCSNEAVSYLLDGRTFPGAVFLNWISNTALYFANTSFALLWCFFVDYKLYRSRKRLRTVYRPMILLSGAALIMILANLFAPILFTIDEQNVYARQPLSVLFFLYPLGYVLVSVVTAVRYRIRRTGVRFFPILSFTVPFLAGCLIQLLFYGTSLAWCSTSIGLAAVYMSMQNELMYQDALTNLYNRYYLNAVLAAPRWNDGRDHAGIMMDVDAFKAINDNYGHGTGDDALRDTARVLRESKPEDAILIRFAGDEFILLLRTDSEEEIEAVIAGLRRGFAEFNRRGNRPYTLSMSMGWAIFRAGRMSADDFLDAIDRAMYEDKRHSARAAR